MVESKKGSPNIRGEKIMFVPEEIDVDSKSLVN
jgi:hypothetical protein